MTGRTSWTAAELMAEDFPPTRWAVPGLLCEGLNVIVSPPKVGKSWFALNLAVAVASGGVALGKVQVDQGSVLYAALEDTGKRLQDRLGKILRGDTAPAALTFTVQCEPIPNGGADRIATWLEAHPDARLVIIDVFAKVRGSTGRDTDAYTADYAAVTALKTLADRFGVSFLVVHHTRKQAAEDFLDAVSGTAGIAGAADAVLVLSRARNTSEAKLSITGRDVEEAEYALAFDPTIGTWTLLDVPAYTVNLTNERRKILAVIAETPGLTPKVIAEQTGLSHDVVKQLVRKMVDAGQLDTDGDGHYLEPHSPVHSVHPFTSDGERGERSECVACSRALLTDEGKRLGMCAECRINAGAAS